MTSQLFVVEGLPCSGKSTTANYISKLTGGLFFDENFGDHPADYEFSAFIPDGTADFTRKELELLNTYAERKNNGIVIPLNNIHGELFNKVLQYKIYDFLDWEIECPVMLEKWYDFAENAGSKIYIFNCVLLQNPMCETMMRFNFPTEQSFSYINEICRIISGFTPTVIYLKSQDIEKNIKSALPERGQDWLDSVINYHCNGGYGKANGLSGFNGYINALEERQRRELDILSRLPVQSIILDNPQQDWNYTYSIIEKTIMQ